MQAIPAQQDVGSRKARSGGEPTFVQQHHRRRQSQWGFSSQIFDADGRLCAGRHWDIQGGLRD